MVTQQDIIKCSIEEGSTSSDSCKLEDIVNGVSDLIPDELLTEFESATDEDKQYIFEDIFDHLNEIAEHIFEDVNEEV